MSCRRNSSRSKRRQDLKEVNRVLELVNLKSSNRTNISSDNLDRKTVDRSTIIQSPVSEEGVYISEKILHEIFGGDFALIDNASFISDLKFMQTISLNDHLRNWTKIRHSALRELLKILKFNVSDGLSVDSRTLLRTPRRINISNSCGG